MSWPGKIARTTALWWAVFERRGNPIAYVCAFLGLRLVDDRPFTGLPDVWLKLPDSY